MDAETEAITVRRPDGNPGILILALNRPAQRNAMSAGLVAQFIDLLDRAAIDSETRAILIVGEGKGFCAGSDLAGLAAMTPAARQAFEAASGQLAAKLACHECPIVAAVTGFAIGGGLTLAAACDYVVTAANAKWSLPEVPIGLFPAWGLQQVIDRVGHAAARRLSFGTETLDGRDAAGLGLADEVADDVMAAGQAAAARFAALPAAQAAAVKSYFTRAREVDAADKSANRLFMDACETKEGDALFAKYGK